jgi:hypothetical protein
MHSYSITSSAEREQVGRHVDAKRLCARHFIPRDRLQFCIGLTRL